MTASILPLDALIAPISPESPTGGDLREVGGDLETRDVAARVFSALYQCCEQDKDGSGDYEARAQRSFARLCRLDVSRAFRDGNA